MSLEVNLVTKISVVETLEGALVDPTDNTVTSNQLSEDLTLTALTTPPVQKHGGGELALVAGAASIDLTNLTGLTGDEAVDGTGLKLQMIKVRNKSTNSNPMTVSKGASNGYGLTSAGASFTWPLDPGQGHTFYGDDASPDIAAGAKTIDVAGTGTDILEYHIVMG